MAALGHISKARHVVVGVAIAGVSALTAFGVIGDGNPEERFDTWQTIVEPGGGEALRITETFDQDFGDNRRHGPERNIPNDYGAPIDIVASSPDAPAAVHVEDEGFQTIIRLGDPDTTVTGQHRYTLSYTLPDAKLSRGFLAIDIIAGDQFETDHAEAVVRGFDLESPRCFVGFNGSTTRCQLEEGDGFYKATFDPLPPYTGITVDGAIAGTTDTVVIDPPPLPDRRPNHKLELTIAVTVLGVLGAVGVYVWARRRGRNEVYAGGAADAAFGALPPPNPDGSPSASLATSLVPDSKLDELATIEFVPPKGIEPWEAAVLLQERLGDDTVQAWLSGLAGREVVEIAESDSKLSIAGGPRRTELEAPEAALLDALIGTDGPYVTGTYDPNFAVAWRNVADMQKERIASSGWWKQLPPGSSVSRGTGLARLAVVAIFVFFFILLGSAASAFVGVFASWPAALLVGLLFPAFIAYCVYRVLLPARSAQGSALALRAESFRRFLHASEAQHVEWAWQHGLLREYSGWAVALGESEAWAKAMERANVPEPARVSAMPAILIATSPSVYSSRVAPSKSGSGSGGFSGGSVGGGGGGGGRGSW